MGAGEIKGAAAKGRTAGAAVGGGWEGRGRRASGLCKEGSVRVLLVGRGGPAPASMPGREPSTPLPIHCGSGHPDP